MKLIKIATMDLCIEGYTQPEEMENILDAAFFLKRQLLYKVLDDKDIAEYAKTNMAPHCLDVDGDSEFDGTQGILNFYTYQFPEHKLKTALQALKYFAGEINSTIHNITGPERQGQKNEVYRIHIKMKPMKQEGPPRINMANGNAYTIFEGILNFRIGEPMDAWQVISRIDKVFDAQLQEFERPYSKIEEEGKATMIDFGVDITYFKRRLQEIKEFAQWAVDNNYQKLFVI
jgi:hypothetical protein